MTYVYRLYNQAGDLLYVGCAKNVESRLKGHRHHTWWSEVASREETGYMTREDALAAEKALIGSARPKYNQMHHPNPGPRQDPPKINYEIPDELHRSLKVLAAQRGTTIKALLIEALEQLVTDEKENQ